MGFSLVLLVGWITTTSTASAQAACVDDGCQDGIQTHSLLQSKSGRTKFQATALEDNIRATKTSMAESTAEACSTGYTWTSATAYFTHCHVLTSACPAGYGPDRGCDGVVQTGCCEACDSGFSYAKSAGDGVYNWDLTTACPEGYKERSDFYSTQGCCMACSSGVSAQVGTQRAWLDCNGYDWHYLYSCPSGFVFDADGSPCYGGCCEDLACVSSYAWSGRRRIVPNGGCPDGYVLDGKPSHSVQFGCCLECESGHSYTTDRRRHSFGYMQACPAGYAGDLDKDDGCCQACPAGEKSAHKKYRGHCPGGYAYNSTSKCCSAMPPTAAPPQADTEVEYTEVGSGVAGPYEIWNVGGAKGKGVEACYQAVLQDSRCNDYFTYVHGGDFNCGCKGSSGGLSIRRDSISTYYLYGNEQEDISWWWGAVHNNGW